MCHVGFHSYYFFLPYEFTLLHTIQNSILKIFYQLGLCLFGSTNFSLIENFSVFYDDEHARKTFVKWISLKRIKCVIEEKASKIRFVLPGNDNSTSFKSTAHDPM